MQKLLTLFRIIGLLVPGSALEEAPSLLLVGAAPLFEEEGHLCVTALVSDVGDPVEVHAARVWP